MIHKKEVQLDRMEFAIDAIEKLGYTIHYQDSTKLMFEYNGRDVIHFAHTGWHTGKGIRDGRGIQKLLKQIDRIKRDVVGTYNK